MKHAADQPSAFRELLSEHHDDPAGTADVRESVNAVVVGHAAKRVASMFRGCVETFVDVVDGKATRCMPISFGRVGFEGIAAGWMYSKSSIRPLPSGVSSIAILAWLPVAPPNNVNLQPRAPR